MEISSSVGQQFFFIIPVVFVIVFAALVFVFGFESSVKLPNFKYLRFSSVDKKTKGKKKSKDKKAQNGHATAIDDDVKPLKQSNKGDKSKKSGESDRTKDSKKNAHKSPAKGGKKEEKKVEKKSGKENKEPPKTKKGAQKAEDKPKDFDDGGWETALSRKDKKNKKKVENAATSNSVGKKAPENKNKSNAVDKAQSGSNKTKSVNNNSNDSSAKNKKKARKD